MISEEHLIRWHAILLEFSNSLSNKFVGLWAEIHLMLRKCIANDSVKMWEKSCVIEYSFPHWTVVLESLGVAILSTASLGSNRVLGAGVSNRSWTTTRLQHEIARDRSTRYTIMVLIDSDRTSPETSNSELLWTSSTCQEQAVMTLPPQPQDVIVEGFFATLCCTASAGLAEHLDKFCLGQGQSSWVRALAWMPWSLAIGTIGSALKNVKQTWNLTGRYGRATSNIGVSAMLLTCQDNCQDNQLGEIWN